MIYITGDADTLRDLKERVGFPGEFEMYQRAFAKANGNFLLATPFYPNKLPPYMPFYVTLEAFESRNSEVDAVIREIREFSPEERRALRDLQEEFIPDECLHLLIIMSALRNEYEEQTQASSNTSEIQNKSKLEIGSVLDDLGFLKDSVAGALHATQQLDGISRLIKSSEANDTIGSVLRDVNAAKNSKDALRGNNTPAAHQMRENINKWAENRLNQANSFLNKDSELLRQQENKMLNLKAAKEKAKINSRRAYLDKEIDSLAKKMEQLKKKNFHSPQAKSSAKNFITNELNGFKRGKKLTSKARFNFKTLPLEKLTRWGLNNTLRTFLRNAAESARMLRGASQSMSLAFATTSMFVKLPPSAQKTAIQIINQGKKVADSKAVSAAVNVLEQVAQSKAGGATIRAVKWAAKGALSAFMNNQVMFGVGVFVDGVEEAINTEDQNRVLAATVASTITGLASLGIGAAATAAIAKILSTGALLGISMKVVAGIGQTLMSALFVHPIIGGVLIIAGGAIVYYFVGDDMKKALKEHLYQQMKDRAPEENIRCNTSLFLYACDY